MSLKYRGISLFHCNFCRVLWSKPIPLAWYFNGQWERKYGSRWSEELCNEWITDDRYLKNFASEVPQCPCALEHALADKGRFIPDFDCDKDANPSCFYHKGAVHCVRSGAPRSAEISVKMLFVSTLPIYFNVCDQNRTYTEVSLVIQDKTVFSFIMCVLFNKLAYHISEPVLCSERWWYL